MPLPEQHSWPYGVCRLAHTGAAAVVAVAAAAATTAAALTLHASSHRSSAHHLHSRQVEPRPCWGSHLSCMGISRPPVGGGWRMRGAVMLCCHACVVLVPCSLRAWPAAECLRPSRLPLSARTHTKPSLALAKRRRRTDNGALPSSTFHGMLRGVCKHSTSVPVMIQRFTIKTCMTAPLPPGQHPQLHVNSGHLIRPPRGFDA